MPSPDLRPAIHYLGKLTEETFGVDVFRQQMRNDQREKELAVASAFVSILTPISMRVLPSLDNWAHTGRNYNEILHGVGYLSAMLGDSVVNTALLIDFNLVFGHHDFGERLLFALASRVAIHAGMDLTEFTANKIKSFRPSANILAA